jgi:hypothetical protein
VSTILPSATAFRRDLRIGKSDDTLVAEMDCVVLCRAVASLCEGSSTSIGVLTAIPSRLGHEGCFGRYGLLAPQPTAEAVGFA